MVLTCAVCCLRVSHREQMLQVLLRITEAVMKRPQENQKKDPFAESLAAILFRVSLGLFLTALLTHSLTQQQQGYRAQPESQETSEMSLEGLLTVVHPDWYSL